MTAQATPHPFSEQQWAQIRQFLDGLDQRQSFWLSGYLAGHGQQAQPGATGATRNDSAVLIGFGTETGNCRALAQRLGTLCQAAGINAEVADLSRIRPRQLSKREHLVIITATHGDGDPPEPIALFHEGLMEDGAPALNGLKFAVLALGDSSYERFCVTGQEFDQRLEALGGERLIARQDCDVDFETPAAQWLERLLGVLPKTGGASPALAAGVSEPAGKTEYNKNQPLAVEVLVNQNLSHARRRQPTHHLELALEAVDFPVEPGDAVGILADNPPERVAAVLNATELSGEQPVLIDGEALPLVQVLRQHRDLTIPSVRFLELWAGLSGDAALTSLLDKPAREQRAFLRDHQVIDFLQHYPARPQAQPLVEALRPLQPRLYDVANSLSAVDDELHLTVKAFDYAFGSRQESGIASRYLLDLQPGDAVRLYPHRNNRFHLPDDPALPLILIADGTGIAPYRAFFQALASAGHTTPCWLVFAEQRFEDDFLYQLDLQQAREEGLLQRVDTVFYKDHAGRRLADPLLEQMDTVAEWLGRGAHLYLCGDKEKLEQTEQALQAPLDARLGEGHWKQLAKAKRLHRNLY
jgi:sulfite reductase (NADPH) flavoprotein alpha-component